MNLNLLRVLRELLRHRNVTYAARSLNLTQPTVSNALSQLRTIFHDEILIPHGRTLQPSALAERLLPRLEVALGSLEALVATTTFDPAITVGAIKIATADYVILLLGNELLNELADLAPDLTVEFTDGNIRSEQGLRMGDIDIFIGPRSRTNISFEGFSNSLLFEDEIVCIVDADEKVGPELGKDIFMERPLVLFTPPGTETLSFTESVLRHSAVTSPKIVRVPNFLIIPYLVQRTGTIALLQRRLAERLANSTNIRIMKPPVDFPKLQIAMWWSPAREHDPSHVWFRQLLTQICQKQFGLAVPAQGADTF